jgi:hypothetical protein
MSSFYGNPQSKAEPKPGTMDFEEVKLENLPPYAPGTYPPQYEGKPPFPDPVVALQVVALRKRPHRKWTMIIILMILGAVLAVALVAAAWHNAMDANKADVNDGPTGLPRTVIATTTIMSVSVDTVTGFPSIPVTHMSEFIGATTTVTPISVPGVLVPGHENNPLPSISIASFIWISTPPASSSTDNPSTGIPADLLPDPGVGPSTSVATRAVETPADDPFPSNHHYQVTSAAAATTPFDNPYGNDGKT